MGFGKEELSEYRESKKAYRKIITRKTEEE